MAPVAVKVDQVETKMSTEAGDSLKQTVTIVDHKIRNLEKRKRKIEIYREDQRKGQVLNHDQLTALAKYGEVVQSLELAQDLRKQFEGIIAEAAKQAKKQQKKEAAEKAARDVSRVKEILVLQDVMSNMGIDEVRADFLAGSNSAVVITDEDLGYIDEVYDLIFPKHSTTDEELPPFQEQVTLAAEHLIAILEGRPKEIAGTTYKYVKELIAKIATCGYLDRMAGPAAVTGDGAPSAESKPTEFVEQGAGDSASDAVGDFSKGQPANVIQGDNKYADANAKTNGSWAA